MAAVTAIVPAAGSGRRFGGDKVFAMLRGRAVIAWTLQSLHMVSSIDEVIPVVSPDLMDRMLRLVEEESFRKVKKVVPGGRERYHSVRNGMEATDEETALVLIHDGVRPLAGPGFIAGLIDAVGDYDGVVPGFMPPDTIKVRDGSDVKETLRRERLVAVQTPQVFRYEVLKRAYDKVMAERYHYTDDAQVVEMSGGRIRIVGGDRRNIKITSPEDLVVAEALLSMNVA